MTRQVISNAEGDTAEFTPQLIEHRMKPPARRSVEAVLAFAAVFIAGATLSAILIFAATT